MQCRVGKNKRQRDRDREKWTERQKKKKQTNFGHLKIFLIPYSFQDNTEMPLLKIGHDLCMFLLCFEDLTIIYDKKKNCHFHIKQG